MNWVVMRILRLGLILLLTSCNSGIVDKMGLLKNKTEEVKVNKARTILRMGKVCSEEVKVEVSASINECLKFSSANHSLKECYNTFTQIYCKDETFKIIQQKLTRGWVDAYIYKSKQSPPRIETEDRTSFRAL